MDITISAKRFREIVTGKAKFRKCLACDNEGREFWEETGCAVLPYPHPDWGDNYQSGPCDTCEGVGYVENNA